jgi:2-dehydropantoate 2-reductase
MEKGRPPAVDFLNGEIVEHGERVGYDARVNRAACDVVWKIARGELQPGQEALSFLYRATAGAVS